MADKPKEKCPYCGKEFVNLSRHKCKKAPAEEASLGSESAPAKEEKPKKTAAKKSTTKKAETKKPDSEPEKVEKSEEEEELSEEEQKEKDEKQRIEDYKKAGEITKKLKDYIKPKIVVGAKVIVVHAPDGDLPQGQVKLLPEHLEHAAGKRNLCRVHGDIGPA